MAVDPAAPQPVDEEFQPYVSDDVKMKEFTPKAILVGVFFGLLFGASTVYLALKAGLTVSASIPVAVLSISVLKKLGGSTILENNIVQTIGSAGESIASGVVFTLPGFLFLAAEGQTRQSIGAPYFSYHVIFTLAVLGGILGVLMMIPLRRALIVNEHKNLPYPEGTACAQVLIAGEKGGEMAATAYRGVAFGRRLRPAPPGPEDHLGHAGVREPRHQPHLPGGHGERDHHSRVPRRGLHHRPADRGSPGRRRRPGMARLIPLLASLVPPQIVAIQLNKLGYLPDLLRPGAYGWNPIHAQLRRAEPGHLLRVRPADRGGRGRRRWLHDAAQDASHHHQQLQGEHRCAEGGTGGRVRPAHRGRPSVDGHRRRSAILVLIMASCRSSGDLLRAAGARDPDHRLRLLLRDGGLSHRGHHRDEQ
jgi:hypothetical protein